MHVENSWLVKHPRQIDFISHKQRVGAIFPAECLWIRVVKVTQFGSNKMLPKHYVVKAKRVQPKAIIFSDFNETYLGIAKGAGHFLHDWT